MADTVTITTYDEAGNVVSVDETAIHTFESAAELEAYLTGDFEDEDDIAAYDEAHAAQVAYAEESYSRPVGEKLITGAEFARCFDYS